jgi:hypothetical protein
LADPGEDCRAIRAGWRRAQLGVSRMSKTAFIMGFSRRYFAPGQLQFVTSSTYRRAKLFDSHRFRCDLVETLRQLRQEKGSLLTQQSRREGIGAFA